MTQVTAEDLFAAKHAYVSDHEGEPGDHQLGFLRTLVHPIMGDIVIQFIDRVADDTLARLRRDNPDSPLIPEYEKILEIEI